MKRKLLHMPVWYPKLVLLMSLVLVVLAAFGSKNLFFRGDYQIFFDADNPQLAAFKEIEATFTKTDSLAVVVAVQDSIFTPEHLNLVRDLTESAWQTPYSSRVDSIANYQHTSADGDDLLVEDLLLDLYPFTEARIAYVKDIALAEPRLRDALISRSGKVAVVNITLNMPTGNQTQQVQEIKHFIDALIVQYQADYPAVTFHLGGVIALNAAFAEAAQIDSTTLIPLMLLIILLFLGLMLRTVSGVFATLLVIIATVAATLGILGWSGHYLDTGSVNVPTLIMTLAVADCVHILSAVYQSMRQGMAKREAIAHSLSANFTALLITSVTTAVGFMMMNASDSPVLRDMGTLSALGVMLALLLALTVLPSLMMLLPLRISPRPQSSTPRALDRFANVVIRFHRLIMPVSLVVVVASAFLMVQNKIEDDSVEYFDTSNSFRQAADFMAANISGMNNISIAVKTGQPQGMNSPAFIKTLDGFTRWLRDQPETDHVASLADTYRRLNMNMHGDDSKQYRLPDEQGLAAQYMLLYEMSLPYGLDLNNEINIDKSSVKLVLTTENLNSKEMVALEARIYQWFADNAPQYDVVASSPTLMFSHIGEVNMASMLKTLPIALVLISILLIVALRSLRLGLISLVPNLVPAVVGFGIWALISGEINLGLSVVVTLTLGIVVDDCVHFLTKYQHARRQGHDAEGGIRYAFGTVGRALWITTVVLVAGFSVLGMSSFRLNSDLGQLSALVIMVALIVDFLLLPALLLMFDRKAYQGETEKDKPALVASL
ncbi:efflux RND transporter permease subunit [Photobacterium aquae]|nr:MMPL family transporter [Photobacterium aquae]